MWASSHQLRGIAVYTRKKEKGDAARQKNDLCQKKKEHKQLHKSIQTNKEDIKREDKDKQGNIV